MASLTLSQFDLYFEPGGGSAPASADWTSYVGTVEECPASVELLSGWYSLLDTSLFEASNNFGFTFVDGLITIVDALEEGSADQFFSISLQNKTTFFTGSTPTKVRFTYSSPKPFYENEIWLPRTIWRYEILDEYAMFSNNSLMEPQASTIIYDLIDDEYGNVPALAESFKWSFIRTQVVS